MTSGNVTSVSPNLMVNNQLSAKDGDKSGGFLDVMSKNVAKSDKKAILKIKSVVTMSRMTKPR